VRKSLQRGAGGMARRHSFAERTRRRSGGAEALYRRLRAGSYNQGDQGGPQIQLRRARRARPGGRLGRRSGSRSRRNGARRRLKIRKPKAEPSAGRGNVVHCPRGGGAKWRPGTP
jgi:hypothetical protein